MIVTSKDFLRADGARMVLPLFAGGVIGAKLYPRMSDEWVHFLVVACLGNMIVNI